MENDEMKYEIKIIQNDLPYIYEHDYKTIVKNEMTGVWFDKDRINKIKSLDVNEEVKFFNHNKTSNMFVKRIK
tara:strand:- start:344 stop:562 length:219 start_codon:yes stop_codon:yes gene_type:complete